MVMREICLSDEVQNGIHGEQFKHLITLEITKEFVPASTSTLHYTGKTHWTLRGFYLSQVVPKICLMIYFTASKICCLLKCNRIFMMNQHSISVTNPLLEPQAIVVVKPDFVYKKGFLSIGQLCQISFIIHLLYHSQPKAL